MCIIVTKALGSVFPEEATLRRCFTSNPDGAGFAWSDSVKTYWKKGFATFESFYAALKEVFPDDAIEREHAAILHFRIGTHGPKKSLAHTHPFPVDAKTLQDTCALTGEASMVLFHNGIIGSMVSVPHEKVTVDGVEVEPSDSQILAHYFVKPLNEAYRNKTFSAKDFNNFMEQLIGTSRIALLGANHEIVLYGSWVTKDTSYPGCSFSNSSYEVVKPVVFNNDRWKNLDTDDGYYNDPLYADFPAVRTPAKTPATPITKITAEYWDEYDKWFKKFPHGTYVEFNRYYVNVSKRKLKREQKATKNIPHATETHKVKPFYGTDSEGYRDNVNGFEKVPAGSLVRMALKTDINVYCPAIDGELYCEKRLSPSNPRTFLYVKRDTNSGIKYFFVGACEVTFLTEEAESSESRALVAQ